MYKFKLTEFKDYNEKNTQKIQRYFFQIRVQSFYTTMIEKLKVEKDKTWIELHTHYQYLSENIINLDSMNIGELLKYAVIDCAHNGQVQETDTKNINLSNRIIKNILIDTFKPFAKKHNIDYQKVCQKIND